MVLGLLRRPPCRSAPPWCEAVSIWVSGSDPASRPVSMYLARRPGSLEPSAAVWPVGSCRDSRLSRDSLSSAMMASRPWPSMYCIT